MTLVHRAAALATSRGPLRSLAEGRAAALRPAGSALTYRNVGLAFVGNARLFVIAAVGLTGSAVMAADAKSWRGTREALVRHVSLG